MKAQPWQKVFSVFEQAVDRPPDERQTFLDRACGDDSALRQGVEMLFAADEEEGASILDRPIVERLGPSEALSHGIRSNGARSSADPTSEVPLADATWTATAEVGGQAPDGYPAYPLPKDNIGPYRILRRVGQGGMSTVYLAVRDDDVYRRQVVIKVVRGDRETESMLRRLRVERQILANLEHPNIARLYDGGNTTEGLPYFVMEYIDGLQIDTYCKQYRLSVDDRLNLFKQVCAAVHYAHQNLVVHRDIKPSNILVTADGVPKLLDFGIAKLLNPGLVASEIEPTATWQRMLTPSYASPEQIRGKLVTTVSDVYSLGVLLYELLTGRLPYEMHGRSAHEIERLLTETEPPKPSQVVAQSTTSGRPSESEKPAAKTGGDSAEEPEPQSSRALTRSLTGDLDAIVLKALRSTPPQRYDSVERFAADIERFQQGLPVAARSGGWRYRATKFVRRNRRGVAALVALAILLLGFAGALLLQNERVRQQRDQAQLESAKKSQVVSLILDIFELSDPYVVPDAELTVREALEHSVPLLADGLDEQPDVRAELLHAAGSILSVLGVYSGAEEQLTEALEIRRGLYGDDSPSVARSMSALAAVRRELDDDLSEAERLAREAVEVLRQRLGPEHPDLTDPLLEWVAVLCYRGKHEAAAPIAEEVLSLTRQLPAEDDRQVAALEYLAYIHSHRGDYREAVAHNRQAVALQKKLYGEKYPGQIATLSNLGLQLRRMGELQAAQQTYEEALRLQAVTFGERYADLILIQNYAGVHYAMGDFSNAEASYRQALAIVLDRYGSDHWRVLSLGLRIARTRTHQGSAAEAERDIRNLLARRLVADDHRLNVEAHSVLGESLSVQGRCAEAEPTLVTSFEAMLGKTKKVRFRQDAFDRLRDHFERCGTPAASERFAAMLEST
ncbi:MAG: serine/threonine-protein kinase [Acidobacteriota bacterium]